MENILFILVFYPMIGALLSYLIGRKSKEARNYFADFVAISEFVLMVYAAVSLQGQTAELPEICGMGLYLTMDGFRGIYGIVAAFMWMMTMIFSREYFKHYRNRNRYYLFQLITLGATMGVFLSGDLYTTFIFFEIMSFTSYVWVAQDEKKPAMRAAETYLAVAVIGGMVLLMGLFLLYNQIHTLRMDQLLEACAACPNKTTLYIAGGCMLVGFGAKAGAFPIHIWLPKAHPVAPAPASALLSGILTKAGVFGMILISCYLFYGDPSWGALILSLGTITMFGGAFLALFSVDLKRTLACSSMSQIGFIMVGIAMNCFLAEEGAFAAWGTVLHMVNHSLIKLDLFMIAGVVYMNLHKLNLNEIRGFGRKKPFLNVAFLMGALGIGGIPLWNGYVSKTLLHESIVEYAAEHASAAATFTFVEWVFLISGGMTVAYMTKLYIALFVEKNENAEVQAKFDAMGSGYMNWQSRLAIGGSAIVLPILGMTATKTMVPMAELAQTFFNFHEEGHVPHFFSWECLKGGLVSIAIGALLYVTVIRKLLMKKEEGALRSYVDAWPKWLDLENLVYRPLFQHVLPFIGIFVCRIGDCLVDSLVVLLRKTVYADRKIPYRTGTLPQFDEMVLRIVERAELHKNKVQEELEEQIIIRRYIRKQKKKEVQESRQKIRFSLSYGMQIAALGMVVILAVLIFF